MCMGMSSFPDPRGYVIATLEVGDEVEIKVGAGHPKTEQAVFEVIISVDGFSALTHTGRVLACTDGLLVNVTSVHYDNENQYPSPVTDKARELLAQVQRQDDWAEDFRQDLL